MKARRLLGYLAWASLAMAACQVRSEEPAEEPAEVEEAATYSDPVDLIPGQGRQVLARLDVGVLAISLDSIQASGGGSDIVLKIGNTTSAGLTDLAATIQWGQLGADGTPQAAPERTREAPVSGFVEAGKWTRAVITLADVPPAELGFIRLSNFGYTALVLK